MKKLSLTYWKEGAVLAIIAVAFVAAPAKSWAQQVLASKTVSTDWDVSRSNIPLIGWVDTYGFGPDDLMEVNVAADAGSNLQICITAETRGEIRAERFFGVWIHSSDGRRVGGFSLTGVENTNVYQGSACLLWSVGSTDTFRIRLMSWNDVLDGTLNWYATRQIYVVKLQ